MNTNRTLLLLLLAVLWGPTFLYNKIATRELPILTLTAIRVCLASGVLLVSLWWRGRALKLPKNLIKHVTIMSVVACCIPFTFFAWGSRTIDVSLAGVIAGSTPLFTATFAQMAGENEQMNKEKLVGIGMGMLGIIVLFLPSLIQGVQGDGKGALLVLGGVVANAVGFVYAKTTLQGTRPSVITTFQLLIASAILVPLAFLFDNPLSLPLPGQITIAATLASAIPGTAFVFIIYHYLVRTRGATYASLVTYLLPIIGMILGVWVLGEQLHWNFWAGSCLIMGSLGLVRRSEDVYQSSSPSKPACEG